MTASTTMDHLAKDAGRGEAEEFRLRRSGFALRGREGGQDPTSRIGCAGSAQAAAPRSSGARSPPCADSMHPGTLAIMTDPTRDAPTKLCAIEGCTRPHKCKGMCAYHYRRAYYATNREHEIKTATERAKGRKRPAKTSNL